MSAPETRRRPGHAQRGMSLIELMVGMTVGLLIMLAAVGSAQLFMARQRQSVDVGSAAGNGMTGIAAIQYEVAHAGLGFYADGAPTCARVNLSVGSATVVSNQPLAPLGVTLSGDATTLDTIYASALEAASPAQLAAAATSSSTSVAISSYLPVAAGQQVMLVPAAGTDLPCTVRTATAVMAATGTSPETLSFDASGVNNQVAFDPVAYTPADAVSQLGTLQWTRFYLSGTDLMMQRPLQGTTGVAMAHNVVAFRVQYGVSDGTSTALAGWQKAVGAYASLDAAHLPLVRAVRVGLVVRSDLPEKTDKDGHCSATADAPVLFDDAVAPPGADWKCYRYRVHTAVVPLRNFILGTGA